MTIVAEVMTNIPRIPVISTHISNSGAYPQVIVEHAPNMPLSGNDAYHSILMHATALIKKKPLHSSILKIQNSFAPRSLRS